MSAEKLRTAARVLRGRAEAIEPIERVLTNVTVDDHGCWVWATVDTHGYGKTSVDDKTTTAHLWLWRTLFGAVPDGMQLDHLCRNRACCNPRHLEPVTPAENIARGHMARGSYWCDEHDAAKERDGRGRMRCKPCRAAAARRQRAARKDAA